MILFIIVKKRAVLFVVLILCAAAAALTAFGIWHRAEEPAQPVFALPSANKVIVVDAGHGGFDAGASDNGLIEKDVNLNVALFLREYIEQGGGIAVMTRTEDVSTAADDKSGKSAKQSDLIQRKNLVQTAQADIFVSIHMNKFPQPQYHGAQVFYSLAPDGSKKLGEAIQQSLKDVLQDGNTRMAKKTDGGVFLLKDTSIPSVIVECGFLSNAQEAKLLGQTDYQRKLAWGIYMGIIRYFNH